jgi:hypothetical protein
MGASAIKIHLLSSIKVCVKIRYLFHISTLEGNNFFGNYAMQKSKFWFLRDIVVDFRYPLKNLEGGLPKEKLEKKMFFVKIVSKLGDLMVRKYASIYVNA